jgi:uncharacterized protein YcbX
MTPVGIVTSLWRYPAKSMMGDSLDALPIDENGVLGDRSWAVRDEVSGAIRGAKKLAGLMQLRARYLAEPERDAPVPPIEIEMPDGTSFRSDDGDVNERLSRFLNREVTLWPLQPASNTAHYRRGPSESDDVEAEFRATFGLEPNEPFPSFEGMPVDVLAEYETLPGTYFDVLPLLLLTTQSLESLSSMAAGSVFDVRRFRPNIVVEAESTDEPFPEQSWIGHRIQLGELELEIAAACPRCVMVTRPFADLPADREVLRTIVRQANQNVGVYARVTRPATVPVGAAVSTG